MTISCDPFEEVQILRGKHPERKAFVLFDADNTIWEGDCAETTLYGAALLDIGNARNDFNEYFGFIDKGETEKAYRFGANMLRGWSEDQVRDVTKAALVNANVVHEEKFNRCTVAVGVSPRRRVVNLMDRFLASGVEVWVVSASPELIVRTTLGFFGIEVTGLIGVRSRFEGNIFTPQLIEPLPIFSGKVDCVKTYIHPTIKPLFGMGDNMNDRFMLEYCEHAGVVDRGNELTEIARESGWFILPQ